MHSESPSVTTSTTGSIESQELIAIIQAARANGVKCLEWAGVKLEMAPYHIDEDDDEIEYEEDETEDFGEEEYVEEPDDEPRELEFKDGRSEVPRPLQLNQEYDEWSAASAPPIFNEKDD